ncbi:TonB-dependent receptor domain-containing protein [Sphingomonas sp. SUN039]|uniref:TonB-dependent receptor domain-containing protein n=1 Tax=Sphingomonas sp. SUN039 TaxID=2937787 RepID=UPI0021647019|nr:TonB-dependent receptor [Sphingomonas sp. SUN039]UVO54372.1 TonB-dependent receptor [Sphingomonas sp. SUN039]
MTASRTSFRRQLTRSVALTALALAGGAHAQTPSADTDAEADKDIVVTGTIIRGAAPVGSSIISANANDIAKTGLLTTSDVLKSIPQVTGIGPGESTTGTTANNSNLNISRANGLNIRGLGVQATLTLLNGRRLPQGGAGAQLFDPNSIPAIALGRIDIVADGASATYGSDAVAGVANLVLRTDVEGVEARARYGFARDYAVGTASAVVGHKWDSGRFMFAAEYSQNDQLLQSDRPEYFSCNQLASGGTNNCAFGGAPGNIVYGTTRFGLPAGSGVGVTEAQLSATPNRLESYVYTTAIPANRRFNAVFAGRQEIAPGFDLWAEGFYYDRRGEFYAGSPGTGSNGSIPATVAVPSTNPNFVRIAGRSTTSQNVEYSFFNDIGDGRIASTYESGYQTALGFDAGLGGSWHVDGYYEYNYSSGQVLRRNELNTALLTAALACTGTVCINPYGSGSAANRAAVQTLLGYTQFLYDYGSHVVNAKIDGTLATIGGGDIKLAVGGQYLAEVFGVLNTSNSGAGPTSLSDVRVTSNYRNRRNVTSAFAEVIVPLFGSANAVPGIDRLELNVAGRWDRYSDAGSTTNPKVGIRWDPVGGLTFRGSFGKSFRAPTLQDSDPFGSASLGSSTTVAGAGRNVLTLLGGNAGIRPEKATTWSFGTEIRPESLRGFTASLNYFNIDYTDVIDTPGNSAAVFSDPALAPYVIINPTVQQINDLVATPIANGVYRPVTAFALFTGTGASNVYAIADGRRNNTGRIQMKGLDFQLNYQFGSAIGDWTLGASGTYVFNYKVTAVPGAAVVERVNQANYPLRFKTRATVGWRSGGFGVNAFVNYTNAYRVVGQVSNAQFTPAIVAPAIQDEPVGAYTTVDATLSYSFGDGNRLLDGLTLSVSAQNLFDRAPPFARVSNSQEYDSANASVLGRMVAFEIRKRF